MDLAHIGLIILKKYLCGEAGLKTSAVTGSGTCRCDRPVAPSSSSGQWWKNFNKEERGKEPQGFCSATFQKYEMHGHVWASAGEDQICQGSDTVPEVPDCPARGRVGVCSGVGLPWSHAEPSRTQQHHIRPVHVWLCWSKAREMITTT